MKMGKSLVCSKKGSIAYLDKERRGSDLKLKVEAKMMTINYPTKADYRGATREKNGTLGEKPFSYKKIN